MRRFFLALTIVVTAAPAFAGEVLVLGTSTEITRTARATVLLIQNLGPKPIFCEVGAAAVANTSHRIQGFTATDTGAAADELLLNVPAGVKVYCICGTPQITGAATVVTETGK